MPTLPSLNDEDRRRNTWNPKGSFIGASALNINSVLPNASLRPATSEALSTIEANAARRLLRQADPQAKLAFLQTHPFFRDTSPLFQERLAPQLVRRSCEQTTATVLEQGAEPVGCMDYLFLTPPDVNTKLELSFEGKALATVSGNSIVGQEVIFGVTRRFLFDARLISGSIGSLWVVPRSVVQSLLQRDVHRDDARMLRRRAHDTSATILKNWYLQPTVNIKLRLFETADHAFKLALVDACQIQFCAAKSVIVHQGKPEESCLCIFRGEAGVGDKDAPTASYTRLSHAIGTSAWAAWWGLLELLGVETSGTQQVIALTDCIVLRLLPDAFQVLRKQYPLPCRLFEKVAMQHLEMLRHTSIPLEKAHFFRHCSEEFMQEIHRISSRWIVPAGEVIITEQKTNEDFYFVSRGNVHVRLMQAKPKVTAMKKRLSMPGSLWLPQKSSGGPELTVLKAGSLIGVEAALGMLQTRPCSVTCNTVCDLCVVSGDLFIEVVMRFPKELSRFMEFVKANQFIHKIEDLSELDIFEKFSSESLKGLFAKCARLTVFKNFLVLDEDCETEAIYILTQGRVSLERDGRAGRHEICAPAIFGTHAALKPNSHNSVTVRSKDLCSFLVVKVQDFSQIVHQFPDIRKHVIELKQTEELEFVSALASQAMKRGGLSFGRPEDDTPVVVDAEEEAAINETLLKIFKDADLRFHDFIRAGMSRSTYTNGEVILKQGERGDSAFLIQAGSAGVEVNGVKVGEVKAGSLIGESALLGGKAAMRTATVRALGEVTGFSLNQDTVFLAFKEFPEEKERLEETKKMREKTNKALAFDEKEEERPKGPGGGRLSISMKQGTGVARLSLKQVADRASGKSISARENETEQRRKSVALARARRQSSARKSFIGIGRSRSNSQYFSYKSFRRETSRGTLADFSRRKTMVLPQDADESKPTTPMSEWMGRKRLAVDLSTSSTDQTPLQESKGKEPSTDHRTSVEERTDIGPEIPELQPTVFKQESIKEPEIVLPELLPEVKVRSKMFWNKIKIASRVAVAHAFKQKRADDDELGSQTSADGSATVPTLFGSSRTEEPEAVNPGLGEEVAMANDDLPARLPPILETQKACEEVAPEIPMIEGSDDEDEDDGDGELVDLDNLDDTESIDEVQDEKALERAHRRTLGEADRLSKLTSAHGDGGEDGSENSSYEDDVSEDDDNECQRKIQEEKKTMTASEISMLLQLGQQKKRHSLTEEVRVKKPVNSSCQAWARKRFNQIKRAEMKRDERLALAGDIMPLLPPGVSFRDAFATRPHSTSSSLSARSGSRFGGGRLDLARNIYGEPVWHEVFG